MIIQQNIFLIGPVGAGKSTIGRQLAKELKMNFIDSDREIEKRCGVDIEWIFDIEGENGFRKREKEIIFELAQLHGIVLATGGGAILKDENRTLLSSRGKVIYLKASIKQQLNRTFKDKKRSFLQVKDRQKKLEELMMEREKLYDEIADVKIETNEKTIKNVVFSIINLLNTR